MTLIAACLSRLTVVPDDENGVMRGRNVKSFRFAEKCPRELVKN